MINYMIFIEKTKIVVKTVHEFNRYFNLILNRFLNECNHTILIKVFKCILIKKILYMLNII
jgi:hypothetical protein